MCVCECACARDEVQKIFMVTIFLMKKRMKVPYVSKFEQTMNDFDKKSPEKRKYLENNESSNIWNELSILVQ